MRLRRHHQQRFDPSRIRIQTQPSLNLLLRIWDPIAHLRSGNTQPVFIVTASYFTHFKERGGNLGRGHTLAWRRLTASLWCFCPCDSTKHHNVRIDFMLWCFQVLQVLWVCLKAQKTELGIDVTIGGTRRCFCFHFALLSCPSRFCFPPLWQSSVWLSPVCQTCTFKASSLWMWTLLFLSDGSF